MLRSREANRYRKAACRVADGTDQAAALARIGKPLRFAYGTARDLEGSIANAVGAEKVEREWRSKGKTIAAALLGGAATAGALVVIFSHSGSGQPCNPCPHDTITLNVTVCPAASEPVGAIVEPTGLNAYVVTGE